MVKGIWFAVSVLPKSVAVRTYIIIRRAPTVQEPRQVPALRSPRGPALVRCVSAPAPPLRVPSPASRLFRTHRGNESAESYP